MSQLPILQQISVKHLMQGRNKVVLEHDDKLYLLTITRKKKLILTALEKDNINL